MLFSVINKILLKLQLCIHGETVSTNYEGNEEIDQTCASGALSSINGAARLMKEASPTPTSLQKNCCQSQIKIWHETGKVLRLWKVESTKTFTYIRHIAIDQKSNELPHPAIAKVQTDNPTPISRNGLWLQTWKCIRWPSNERGSTNCERSRKKLPQHEAIHLLAREANIGEAIRSPTINADDRTPSWKLFKLKSPLKYGYNKMTTTTNNKKRV